MSASLSLGLLAVSLASPSLVRPVVTAEHYPPPRPQPAVSPAVSEALPHLPAATKLSAVLLPSGAGDLAGVTRPWLGQPITPRLITDIELALDRRLGQSLGQRPLMARFTPGPALNAGVLAFDIVPAVVGRVSESGTDDVKKRLGLKSGSALDRAGLGFDIDSLNRYPFRQVKATLTPAISGNSVDVDLAVTRDKPWQITSGVKYAGGPGRTMRRLFLTGTSGGLLGRDSVLAFQLTGSPDAVLRERKRPKYAELYLTYTKPTGRRGLLEASFDFSGARFHFAPYDYWIVESDGTLGYRYTLTGPSHPRGESDVRYGVEARHERVQTYSGATQLGNLASETFESYFGYHSLRDGAKGHADFDLSLHVSPGNVDRGNGNAYYAVYNEGRVRSARYAYAALSYDRTSKLNAALSWHVQLTGQASSGPMPFIDQPLIGGISGVRGYFLPDGSFDDLIIARNDLNFTVKGAPAIALYVFVDNGAGYDAALRQTTVVASAGIGAKFPLGKHADMMLEVARTLRAGPVTRAGSMAVETVLTFKY